MVVNGNVLDTHTHHVALVSKRSFLQLFLGISELCIRVIVDFMQLGVIYCINPPILFFYSEPLLVYRETELEGLCI